MSEEDESFDPYRFGHPDVPPPPEFRPPGYKPPPVDLSKPAPPPGSPPGPPPFAPEPPQYGHPQAPYPPAPPVPYPPYSPGPYGSTPYPAPYGQYPPYSGQVQTGTSGKAVAAMVLGILSVVFFWTTILDVVLIIMAVIFGVLGLNEARTQRRGGRGQAIAGLVCAGLAAVLVVVTLVVFVRAADKCGGLSNSDSPGFNSCVRDHVFSQRR